MDSDQNNYVVCNATHSIDPEINMYWEKWDDNEVTILPLTNTTVVQDVDDSGAITLEDGDFYIPSSRIDSLCLEYGHLINSSTIALSLDYAPLESLYFRSEEEDLALVQQRYLVLLLCNVGENQGGVFKCIIRPPSGRRLEQSMEVSVRYPDTTPKIVVESGAIAGVVISALVIIAVMIVLVVCGVRRYHQLKYEALHMRPMSIPLPVTQLATAINHTFATMSPIGSPMYNKFEFPRENLILLEVIGEHQSALSLVSPYVCFHCLCVCINFRRRSVWSSVESTSDWNMQ